MARTDRFPYAIYFIWEEPASHVAVRRVLHFSRNQQISAEPRPHTAAHPLLRECAACSLSHKTRLDLGNASREFDRLKLHPRRHLPARLGTAFAVDGLCSATNIEQKSNITRPVSIFCSVCYNFTMSENCRTLNFDQSAFTKA